MNHKNTIEINGKVYDAKSGILLDVKEKSIKATISQPSIDGVVSPPKRTLAHDLKPAHPKRKGKPSTNRSAINHRKSRAPQKSHILMRQAVKRPQGTATPVASVQSFTRQRPNADIPKSPYVYKFGQQIVKPVTKTAHVPYQQPPENGNHDTSTTPHPSALKVPKHKDILHQERVPTASSKDIFDKAIADAPTHKARAKVQKTKARRIGKLVSFMGSFLLLVGFITYMNMAAINLQVASSQAGFTASNPGYVAAGFSPNRTITHEPGKVTLLYNSNSDSRTYRLTQEVSSWNSSSLQENYLSAHNKKYQTSQEAGRTVFLYDNGKATWVNGGIWYTIDSKTLSSDQLLKIASSL